MGSTAKQKYLDGFHLVVKKDCATCEMVEPVARHLAETSQLFLYVQDDPEFLHDLVNWHHDETLEHSFHLDIETVPTLIKFQGGREVSRTIGWYQEEWAELTGIAEIGSDLPAMRPGCGSKSVEPGAAEHLQVRYGETSLDSRTFELSKFQDDQEYCYDRGWSDGLPVVPPTPERIVRMLSGTHRDPDEIIGDIPPNLAPCTVEKVTINAVLAGCRPEYMPVLLTALKAAL